MSLSRASTAIFRPSRTPLLKPSLLTVTVAITLYATSAEAETKGLEAFNAYVAGLKDLGLTVQNEAINYDATTDTLTITNASLGFAGVVSDIPNNKTKTDGTAPETTNKQPDQLAYDLSVLSGTMTIIGLAEDDNVFSAKSWTYSDDTSFSVSAVIDGQGRMNIGGRMTGAAAQNYAFTMPALPAADPKHQASRWLPFVKSVLLSSYDEVRVDTTAMTVEAYSLENGAEKLLVSGTMQLDGYRVEGADNGHIALYTQDKFQQTLETVDDTSGEKLIQTTTQGKTVYENLDANAFLAVFDPDIPETGDELTVIGHASVVDYSSNQELGGGLAMDLTIDRNSLRDFTVVKRENSVLGLLDAAISGDMPEPEELISGIFQLYRSFGVADARVSGINVKITEPGQSAPIAVGIKEVAMTDINSDGIGEMMLVGLNAPDLPDGAAISLDWAAISGIEFAEYGPMKAMIGTLIKDPDYGEKQPLEVLRAFLPRSFGYEVEGLEVTVPEVGRTRVGHSELAVSTTVPPIPTSYFARNEDIRIPAAALDDEDLEGFLRALGISEVVWSDETRLYWDEATKELHLERLKLNMEGVGTAEASARFGNVPKALFEDPQGQGQMALVVAQFIEAKIRFVDGGLTAKGLDHVAKEQNIPAGVFREALAEQAAEATAPIGNAAFTDMVRSAVSEFLENPGEITVSLSPAAPVPVAQIVGSLAAPQTLPDLLNVWVKAN